MNRVPRLRDDDQRFADKLARATQRDDILDASTIERGRIVNLFVPGRLGAMRQLPPLGKLSGLERLDVSNNQLEVLDLSRRPKRLFEVYARKNRLRSVDLRGCFDVEIVDLRNNRLRSLDVTGLVRVDAILVSGNPLARLVATDLLAVVHPGLRRATKKLVLRKATTHEIHYACDMHNWDDGMKLLKWAVRQPQCDPTTALMIYFRAQPAYHFEKMSRARDDVRMRKWLKSIETRLWTPGAFGPSTVAYEPEKDVGWDDVASEYVPQRMKLRAVAVKGSPRYPFPQLQRFS